MSLSELTTLQTTLNVAIDAFKAELAAQNLPEPSLNTSKPHPIDNIAYTPTPVMFEARRSALASMGLIKSLIQSPHDALAINVGLGNETASVRLVAEIGLPTILGDSEDGMNIREIGEKTGISSEKLERVLRLLISMGWFRETKPSHFANNRLSNLIRKDQPGFYLATYMNSLVSKISGSFSEMINHPDPEFRTNTDPFHTAFQLAYKTDKSYFGAGGWLTQEPQEAIKFGLAMGALNRITSGPGVVMDFPWDVLVKGKDAVIDVGGGQGTLCCSLAVKYPDIKKFIVQDLPETREAAETFISSKGLSDRVEFEVQDFFQPQKRKGKYIFVLQHVLHDWSTADGAKMIKHIKDVLNEDSCFLIIDTIIQSAVVSSEGPDLVDSLSSLKKGVYQPVPPPPFIPVNFGEASRPQHQINVGLTSLCNAFERTLPQLQEMVELGGMKIKKIHATRGLVSITEVVPA